MTAYVIRRAIQGFIILWISTVVLYFLLGQIPGSAFSRLLNPDANGGKTYTMADVQRLERLMGWDKPWYQRYFVWLFDPAKTRPEDNPIDIRVGSFRLRGSGFLTGNWGMSMTVANGYPALELIKSRLPNTVLLMSTSIIVSLLIAFPIGIVSAVRQYSRLDYTLTTFSFFGLSMPSFWLGIMLIILFRGDV